MGPGRAHPELQRSNFWSWFSSGQTQDKPEQKLNPCLQAEDRHGGLSYQVLVLKCRTTYVFSVWLCSPGVPAEPVWLGPSPAGLAARVHSQQLPLAALFLPLAGLPQPGPPHVLVRGRQGGLGRLRLTARGRHSPGQGLPSAVLGRDVVLLGDPSPLFSPCAGTGRSLRAPPGATLQGEPENKELGSTGMLRFLRRKEFMDPWPWHREEPVFLATGLKMSEQGSCRAQASQKLWTRI